MKFSSARRRQILARSSVVTLVFLWAGLAAIHFGCSSVAIEEEPTPQAQKAGQAPSQQTGTVDRPGPTAPTPKEQALESQAFRVQDLQLLEERGQTTLRIKFSTPISQYRHFPLTTPTRIVLDVYGDAKRIAQVENFRVDTHWISGLRLSSSEGYLRLVIDIAAAIGPSYLVEQENGGLRVVIGPTNPNLTAKKDLQLVQNGKRSDILVAEAKAPTPEVKRSTPEGGPTPASISQGAAAADKKYTGQRISLDFKDADIKNVFRLLAEVSGLNIVVTGDVQKKVTVRLVDIPWDQALDLLVKTNGLDQEPVGNVIRISTAGTLRSEREGLAAANKAAEAVEPPQIAYLSLNYATAKELAEKVKQLLTTGAVLVPDERSNILILRGIKKAIEEATNIVSRLDIRTPQVLIESNLIETTPTFSRALGFELDLVYNIRGDPSRPVAFTSRHLAGAPFSGAAEPEVPPIPIPTSGLRFGTFQDRVGAIRNLNSFITAAEEQGKIRIISRPSVVTLNNKESTIKSERVLRVLLPSSGTVIGGTAPQTTATEEIPVGITLTVTPQVSSDGFILMKIFVKSSTLGTQSPGSAIPDELSREAISNVLVRDGETIVIGGIMKDTNATSESGIPYLKDIPILGWLFKNIRWQKDFEELMVFITPRIIAAGSENLPTAEQLWREQLRQTEGG